jgi:ATP-dependent Lon protease
VKDAALLNLIENYCREAGVRNLQKQIEKIYRKVCFCLFIFSKKKTFGLSVLFPTINMSPLQMQTN